MRTKRLFSYQLLIVTSLIMSACSTKTNINSSSSNSSESTSTSLSSSVIEETYTIQFISKDEVVYEVNDAHYGDYIDIPVLSDEENPRNINTGWIGISDDELAAGKVMVYESDATYIAIWNERFGTNEVYNATRIKLGESITIDGVKDSSYEDCSPVLINQKSEESITTNAKAYFMWDENCIYAFLEVEDEHYVPYADGASLHGVDSIDLFIDLLHNDSLAEFGYTTGWGKPYRGEPGPMCEGWFTISAGADYPKGEVRYGNDSMFRFEGWLSNAAKDSGVTVGTTKKTEKGYNVEYVIDCTNPKVPSDLLPHLNQEIGLGINIFDKEDNSNINVDSNRTTSMEEINTSMKETPKRLSNIKLVANPRENYDVLYAYEVRDGFTVSSKDELDLLFKDSTEQDIDENNNIQLLWDDKGIYSYLYVSGLVEQIDITVNSTGDKYSINETGKLFIPKTGLSQGYFVNVNMVLTDIEENKTEKDFVIYCIKNANNLDPARKSFTAKKLAEEEVITIDGIKDDGYNLCEEIDVSTQSLVEKASLSASGKAYLKWDDNYLYAFIDVTDANVDSETITSEPWLNDSTELWISTCRTLPTVNTGWGDKNRPYSSYCGEGGFRVRAGDINGENITGMHWMYDWKDGVERQIVSKLTDSGYVAEYKIAWASFAAVEDKEGIIIDLNININDGEESVRKGIVSTNAFGHETYFHPAYLDHVTLVG